MSALEQPDETTPIQSVLSIGSALACQMAGKSDYDVWFTACLEEWRGLEPEAKRLELDAERVMATALAASEGKNVEARKADALEQKHVRDALTAANQARVDANTAYHLLIHLRGREEKGQGQE